VALKVRKVIQLRVSRLFSKRLPNSFSLYEYGTTYSKIGDYFIPRNA
jgi:hypothetical protein